MTSREARLGFTVIELMTTLAIVAVLATTAGVLFAKLLAIRERDREEGYVRERLAEVCGSYADLLSIGSSIIVTSTNAVIVKYRQEAGGVSFETGVVTRVAYLTASLNVTNRTADLGVYTLNPGEDDLDRVISRSVDRRADGNAMFIPQTGDVAYCTLTPLVTSTDAAVRIMNEKEKGRERYLCAKMVPGAVFDETGSALGLLEVRARYRIEDKDGRLVDRFVTAERVVRLWNRE